MMYETQILWLEETEDSVKAIQDAEYNKHELGIDKTIIPSPVFMLYTKKLIIDLSFIVSVGAETITLGGEDYILPEVTLVNGEIHTLNEDIHELNKVILKAKKQEGFGNTPVARPIEQAS